MLTGVEKETGWEISPHKKELLGGKACAIALLREGEKYHQRQYFTFSLARLLLSDLLLLGLLRGLSDGVLAPVTAGRADRARARAAVSVLGAAGDYSNLEQREDVFKRNGQFRLLPYSQLSAQERKVPPLSAS